MDNCDKNCSECKVKRISDENEIIKKVSDEDLETIMENLKNWNKGCTDNRCPECLGTGLRRHNGSVCIHNVSYD